MAAPTPRGRTMTIETRMMYTVLAMWGRIPTVPLSTLLWVDSSSQVIRGRPRAKM